MSVYYNSLLDKLHFLAAQRGIPIGATFELTSRCTLDCKMCYIHRAANDLKVISSEKSTDWWLNIANKSQEAGVFSLLLTGGEPMIRNDFDEIYSACHNSGMLTSVNTNATLISDKRKDLFCKLRPQRLNITMYGYSAETYEKLCGNGKVFETVKNNILDLKKQGISIRLNYTITPLNHEDMYKVFDFAEENGIVTAATSYLYPPTRLPDNISAPFRSSPEQAAEFKLEWKRRLIGDDILSSRFERFKKGSTAIDINEECDEINGDRINCRAGKTTFWISWDGKMTPCGVMTSPVTEITDFNDAWNYIKEKRNDIYLPAKCKTCVIKDFCDVCAGVNMSETGATDEVSEYMCRYGKHYYEVCKEQFDR